MEILLNLTFIPIIIFLNLYLKKKNFLVNYAGLKHQLYTNQNSVPISGGLILLIFFIFNFNEYENFLLLFLFIFFLIGVLGDLNLVKSTFFRFFLQILFVVFFIFFFELNISNLRIDLINSFLENSIFNYFFVSFCLLVFINGSNFIDGNNTLSLGYFIIVLILILFLKFLNINILFNDIFLFSLLTVLIILYVFNFLNRIYLGDNGIYILSLFFGYYILKIHSLNLNISPYFIALLFWYPSFEMLFSFIRKLISKNSPMNADNNHLHQLLYFFLKKKIPAKFFANTLTGLVINMFNIIVVSLSLLDIYNTKYQILILCIIIIIYTFLYISLKHYKKINI